MLNTQNHAFPFSESRSMELTSGNRAVNGRLDKVDISF